MRELVRALAVHDADNDYRLFVAGARTTALPTPPAPNFAWRTTPITNAWWARLWHRARLPYPVENITGALDLFHATDFVLPPTRSHTRTILTVHDLTFIRAPETASPNLKAYLDAVVPRSVSRADHVLADSQATKDDLIELYSTPPDKITVLYSGVDAVFRPILELNQRASVRAKYKLSTRPYIFAVGTVQPRKNYVRLIQALAVVRAAGHDIDLVIAGGRGWLDNPIYDALRDQRLESHVHMIGFADDADLPALYNDALCIATPSIYEGFGLPVLEAFACGTPVVTANVSSLPEVAGDAALLIDPTDVDALADALTRLITDESLRAELITKGFARAKQFTWDEAAHQLRRVYGGVLNGGL